MAFAKILLKLWRLRLWVGLGVLVAGVAAAASLSTSHATVYASAETQMLVDSPNSALANAGVDLTGYLARASVFARLMTSAEALQYIGRAAGINGNMIDATGPIEINGSPTATHPPVEIVGGRDLAAPPIYKLTMVQNPSLPTVDVYADAPTTAQAIALANGAVTGFASFVNQLNAGNVPLGERIIVRPLGQAIGGMVDASAGKKIAVLVFVGAFVVWCWIVLSVARLLTSLRAARRHAAAGHHGTAGSNAYEMPEGIPAAAAVRGVAADLPRFELPRDAPVRDLTGEVAVNGSHSHRAWATTDQGPKP